MTLLRNLGSAFVAVCFLGSSASAVTVTVTHIGSLEGIFYNDPAFVEVPGQTMRPGDTVTITYSIDLDQTPVSIPDALTGSSIESSPTVEYTTSEINVSSSSGYNAFLGAHKLGLASVARVPSSDGTRFYSREMALYRSDDQSERLNSFDGIAGLTPFSLDLADAMRRPSDYAINYADMFIAPEAFGLQPGDCFGVLCEMFVGFDSTSFSGLTPTPVPVPAPFLMLGMALFGLFGFGRRAEV